MTSRSRFPFWRRAIGDRVFSMHLFTCLLFALLPLSHLLIVPSVMLLRLRCAPTSSSSSSSLLNGRRSRAVSRLLLRRRRSSRNKRRWLFVVLLLLLSTPLIPLLLLPLRRRRAPTGTVSSAAAAAAAALGRRRLPRRSHCVQLLFSSSFFVCVCSISRRRPFSLASSLEKKKEALSFRHGPFFRPHRGEDARRWPLRCGYLGVQAQL